MKKNSRNMIKELEATKNSKTYSKTQNWLFSISEDPKNHAKDSSQQCSTHFIQKNEDRNTKCINEKRVSLQLKAKEMQHLKF